MLIYHPALDAHHCVFRVLALLSECDEMEKDRLQILTLSCASLGRVGVWAPNRF